MTYHSLGVTPEELRARITVSAPSAATQTLERKISIEATRAAPKPSDIVQIPRECRDLRVASFEAFERHEPPTSVVAKSGLLMFTVKLPEAWLARHTNIRNRTQLMASVLHGIQNRMRPAVAWWPEDEGSWREKVVPQLATAQIAGASQIKAPDSDTAWRLNWNHSGPSQKQPRHITSINSVPDVLFDRIVGAQTDGSAAEALSWLHSVQPGPGGILPKEGIIWYSIDVLRNPRMRNYAAGSDAKGDRLLGGRYPFKSDDLTAWATRIASSELRQAGIASIAVAIPSWIPDVRIDDYGPQNAAAVDRQVRQTGSYHAGDWRDTVKRELQKKQENERLHWAGYWPMEPGSTARPKKREYMTPGDVTKKPPVVGAVSVFEEPRLADDARAYINVGDERPLVIRYSTSSYTPAIPASVINTMYDLASVLGSAAADLFTPFLTQSLIGPRTDRAVRESYEKSAWRIDAWVDISRFVTERPGIVARAMSVGEAVLQMMKSNPRTAMQVINEAIRAVQYAASTLQRHASSFSSGGWATKDLDGPIERQAQMATMEIRSGLNNAIEVLNRRMTGATESQKLHARCLLFKKANYEGRHWPKRLRDLIPILEEARRAAIAALPHVPAALEAYNQTLRRLLFIKSQIPLPWWARRAGPLPVWGWGALGVTGFLGGAYALRRRRKKRLKKKGVKKNYRLTSR